MKNILYPFINIRVLVTRRGLIAVMIILSQIASLLSVWLSVGFINNSLKSKQEATYDQKWFGYVFYNDEDNESAVPEGALVAPEWGSVKDKMYELLDFLGDNVEDIPITCRAGLDGYDSAWIGVSSDLKPNNAKIVKGPRFSCSDYNVYGDVGRVYHIEGQEYTVTEVGENKVHIAVNSEDIPDKARLQYFSIKIIDAVSTERIDEIRNKLTELFGESKEIYLPEPAKLMEIQIDNMFIFTSAVILLISVVNISVYFCYIFRKRERQTAIMKICGASSGNIFIIFLTEMLGSFLVSLLIALKTFDLILPKLAARYEGFALFENRWYVLVFAVVYFTVSGMVSAGISMRFSSASPSDSYRRAQKGGV